MEYDQRKSIDIDITLKLYQYTIVVASGGGIWNIRRRHVIMTCNTCICHLCITARALESDL